MCNLSVTGQSSFLTVFACAKEGCALLRYISRGVVGSRDVSEGVVGSGDVSEGVVGLGDVSEGVVGSGDVSGGMADCIDLTRDPLLTECEFPLKNERIVN